MKDLIESNYRSIVGRGLINSHTKLKEFISKLDEEVNEFKESNEPEELADIILVCLNIAKHYDIDIEKELKNKIIKNQNR
jgi:predicted house-cleaning noncanonical NTP pyrophosphatase (MazG superfamily)